MVGRVYRWRGRFWLLRARPEPFDRGPRRNVLLERVEPASKNAPWCHRCIDGETWYGSDELVIRPFRGLRRALA